MKTKGELYQSRERREEKRRRVLNKIGTALSVVFIALALAGCSNTKAAVDPQSITTPNPGNTLGHTVLREKESVDPAAITAAHNKWRSQVGVPGLTWSDELVNVAQSWANTLEKNGCGFYHSLNGYGENLFMASPLMWSDGRRELQKISPEKVTDSWGNEIKHYNYANNSCTGVCGHYTQVVWKETKEVGCAKTVCDDKSQIWVCSYSPAGNMVGQKPY